MDHAEWARYLEFKLSQVSTTKLPPTKQPALPAAEFCRQSDKNLKLFNDINTRKLIEMDHAAALAPARAETKSRPQTFRVPPILNITTGKERQAPAAERPVARPPEFKKRVMLPIHEFNADANRCLAHYNRDRFVLRRYSESHVTATLEAIAHSQALILKIDAFIAKVLGERRLWPAY
jgi:hypothetical protein